MKELLKDYFLNKVRSIVSFEDIIKDLNLSGDEIDELSKTLCILEEEHFIMHNKASMFAPLKFFNLIYGSFSLKGDGFGFIDSETGEHVHLSKKEASILINGDLVVAKVKPGISGNPEGHVERIVKRAHDEYLGKVIFYHKRYFLETLTKYGADFLIDEENLHHAKVGDMVKVKPLEYYPERLVRVEVVEIIGNANDPYMDMMEIANAAGARTTFSKELLDDASKLSLDLSDKDSYIDKTNELIITIDGDDAKDFDDAVSLKILDNGNYLLGVYIADVSSYVKEDSTLDIEAELRGCSIYLPNLVIPMLPPILCDDLCSLKEGNIRKTLAVEMEFDSKGILVNHNIFKALIKSSHRMTYSNCNKILDGDKPLSRYYSDVVDMLDKMADLAEILNYNRCEHGAFDFGTSESSLILNQDGDVKDVIVKERGISEAIIEEFMIVTNCTIANDFSFLDVPFIYRVHAKPDAEKISKLLLKLSAIGYNNNKKKYQNHVEYLLQDILKENRIDDDNISVEEKTRRMTINNEVIRSMQKAVYQETNIGHFGLAAEAYTHFTSPIRRYPDLMVHRLVKAFLLGEGDYNTNLNHFKNLVNEVSTSSSKLERLAESTERDVVKYKECEYMERFVGDKTYGTITSITSFGIFVTLDNLIEGLSRYADMSGYFEFDEITETATCVKDNLTYRIGDRVILRIEDANKFERTIDFKILRKE